VTGLDEVLRGGLPAGRMTLISGGAGSGKSLIALQCALHGARHGEPCIVVLFEERAAAVRQNVLSLGWDVRALERSKGLFLLDARLNPEAVVSGDFSIKGLLAILAQQVKALGARRIVFDAVDTLLQLHDSLLRERHELSALHEWLLDKELKYY
jgi:circadian clock protein KaiC